MLIKLPEGTLFEISQLFSKYNHDKKYFPNPDPNSLISMTSCLGKLLEYIIFLKIIAYSFMSNHDLEN